MLNQRFKYIFSIVSLAFILLDVNPMDDFNLMSFQHLPNVFQTEWVMHETSETHEIISLFSKNEVSRAFSHFIIFKNQRADYQNNNIQTTLKKSQNNTTLAFDKPSLKIISIPSRHSREVNCS